MLHAAVPINSRTGGVGRRKLLQSVISMLYPEALFESNHEVTLFRHFTSRVVDALLTKGASRVMKDRNPRRIRPVYEGV